MQNNFSKSFELTVGHEGGFQNDRRDRGNWTTGRIGQGSLKGTKYGITAMSYPDLDIPRLTVDDAKAIYRRDYWDLCSCDALPYGVDYLVFDMAVNHGPVRARKFIQEALGVTQDGIIGPITFRAITEAEPISLITKLVQIRQHFYTNIGTWAAYGKGWSRRNVDTLVEAISMVPSSSASQPTLDKSNEEPEETFQQFWFRKI